MIFAINISHFFFFNLFLNHFKFSHPSQSIILHFTGHLVYFHLISFPDKHIFLEKRDSFDWRLLSSEHGSHVIF